MKSGALGLNEPRSVANLINNLSSYCLLDKSHHTTLHKVKIYDSSGFIRMTANDLSGIFISVEHNKSLQLCV